MILNSWSHSFCLSSAGMKSMPYHTPLVQRFNCLSRRTLGKKVDFKFKQIVFSLYLILLLAHTFINPKRSLGHHSYYICTPTSLLPWSQARHLQINSYEISHKKAAFDQKKKKEIIFIYIWQESTLILCKVFIVLLNCFSFVNTATKNTLRDSVFQSVL